MRPHYGTGEPRITENGYRLRYAPSHPLAMSHGYVYEHRMVAWDEGILTDPGDVVHHRNGDKLDNDPGNLVATSQGDHVRGHVAERGYVVNQHGRHSPRGGVMSSA